jgi:hypothetical protein
MDSADLIDPHPKKFNNEDGSAPTFRVEIGGYLTRIRKGGATGKPAASGMASVAANFRTPHSLYHITFAGCKQMLIIFPMKTGK